MSTPSEAVQILVTVIPIVGIVAGSAVLFSFLYFNHKQKMFSIEKGVYQKISFDFDAFSLFTGFLLSGAGAALTLFFLLKEGMSYGLIGGLVPLGLGISFILYYFVKSKTTKK
ncbi:MAG: DUF6249 domain-containing protein [Spirochaetota bacterium]